MKGIEQYMDNIKVEAEIDFDKERKMWILKTNKPKVFTECYYCGEEIKLGDGTATILFCPFIRAGVCGKCDRKYRPGSNCCNEEAHEHLFVLVETDET